MSPAAVRTTEIHGGLPRVVGALAGAALVVGSGAIAQSTGTPDGGTGGAGFDAMDGIDATGGTGTTGSGASTGQTP